MTYRIVIKNSTSAIDNSRPQFHTRTRRSNTFSGAFAVLEEEVKWESCEWAEIRNDVGTVLYRAEGDFA